MSGVLFFRNDAVVGKEKDPLPVSWDNCDRKITTRKKRLFLLMFRIIVITVIAFTIITVTFLVSYRIFPHC